MREGLKIFKFYENLEIFFFNLEFWNSQKYLRNFIFQENMYSKILFSIYSFHKCAIFNECKIFKISRTLEMIRHKKWRMFELDMFEIDIVV